MPGPSRPLAGRAFWLHLHANIAGNLRRFGIVEEAGPARPVEVDRDGAGGETRAEIVPDVVGGAGRHGLRLVEVHEPVERAHTGFRVEGRLAILVEIFAALGDQHLVETPDDAFILAGELRAIKIWRCGEEFSLFRYLFPGVRRHEVGAVFFLVRLLLGLIGIEALLVIKRRHVELRARQHHQLAANRGRRNVVRHESIDLGLGDQRRQVRVQAFIDRCEG